MFKEKVGEPVYFRPFPAVDALAEDFMQRWQCKKYEAINTLALLGGICAHFVMNMQPLLENGQGDSGGETQALLTRMFGGVRF